MVRKRFIVGVALILVSFGIGGTFLIGTELMSPTQEEVGSPPRKLNAEDVEFRSQSGAMLKGWLVRRPAENGAVVLMHGINTNRLTMLSRARFLVNSGYSVLLFDFQSHGESIGKHHTFGYLESLDARAACEYLTSRLPNAKKGVIGTSLGGAAAVLGPGPLDVKALVLEAVFPTIEEATANRIARRLGEPARLLAPLLLWQLQPRLGISARQLRPIDQIGAIKAPLLLIAGGADKDTTPLESQRLFRAAPEPKEYWEIAGAAHQDFYLYAPKEYETRVLAFLGRYLRSVAR